MRKILLVFTIATCLATSCAKKSTPTPTPQPNNPSSNAAHFIPNWHTDDTLYAITLDSMNQANGADTIITKSVNDTSYIIWQGKQYYIWKEPATIADTFLLNQQQYVNVVISPTKNIDDAISTSLLNAVSPYKYKDQQGNWSYQRQILLVNDYSKMKKVNLGAYISYKQYN